MLSGRGGSGGKVSGCMSSAVDGSQEVSSAEEVFSGNVSEGNVSKGDVSRGDVSGAGPFSGGVSVGENSVTVVFSGSDSNGVVSKGGLSGLGSQKEVSGREGFSRGDSGDEISEKEGFRDSVMVGGDGEVSGIEGDVSGEEDPMTVASEGMSSVGGSCVFRQAIKLQGIMVDKASISIHRRKYFMVMAPL